MRVKTLRSGLTVAKLLKAKRLLDKYVTDEEKEIIVPDLISQRIIRGLDREYRDES